MIVEKTGLRAVLAKRKVDAVDVEDAISTQVGVGGKIIPTLGQCAARWLAITASATLHLFFARSSAFPHDHRVDFQGRERHRQPLWRDDRHQGLVPRHEK